jgi:hypothetical protein
MSARPQEITFAEMRDMGVRGLLVYCADYCCSHSVAISGDGWPMMSGCPISSRGLCAKACGKRGADMRPDFNWNRSSYPASARYTDARPMPSCVASWVIPEPSQQSA